MVLGLALAALAQQPPAVSPSAASSVDNDFIQKQFGSTCKLMPGPPQMKADLDGDGVEDLVVAARCTNALADQAEDNFTVIDPYNSFYGYGNTKITTQFASEDPATRGLVLLVIHGSWCRSLAGGYAEGEVRDHQSAVQTDCGEEADSEEEDGDGHLCRRNGRRSYDLRHVLGWQEVSVPADWLQHGAVKRASDVGPRTSARPVGCLNARSLRTSLDV